MKTTVIGLGTMGGRMAAALRTAGLDVTGYDIDPAASDAARRKGILLAYAREDAWAESEVVLLSLPGPAECRETAEAISRQASRVRVVVDLSTVDPQTSRDCAAALAGAGVSFLDAPVLGRPSRCGAWTLPVGGDEAALEIALPALQHLATNVRRVGDAGAGSAVKLLNNLMFAVINAVSVQVLHLAPQVGVDPKVFYDTVAGSGAATVSPLFREVGEKVLTGDFSPAFSLALLEKDNRLGLDMARVAGGDLPLNAAVATLVERALAEGLGGQDTAALIHVLKDRETQVETR